MSGRVTSEGTILRVLGENRGLFLNDWMATESDTDKKRVVSLMFAVDEPALNLEKSRYEDNIYIFS